MIYQVGNVFVVFTEDLEDATREEAQNYVDYVKEHVKTDGELAEILVSSCDDGTVDLNYRFHAQKFERIRRITGYLSGDLSSWNDSKRDEERDRIKHLKIE